MIQLSGGWGSDEMIPENRPPVPLGLFTGHIRRTNKDTLRNASKLLGISIEETTLMVLSERERIDNTIIRSMQLNITLPKDSNVSKNKDPVFVKYCNSMISLLKNQKIHDRKSTKDTLLQILKLLRKHDKIVHFETYQDVLSKNLTYNNSILHLLLIWLEESDQFLTKDNVFGIIKLLSFWSDSPFTILPKKEFDHFFNQCSDKQSVLTFLLRNGLDNTDQKKHR